MRREDGASACPLSPSVCQAVSQRDRQKRGLAATVRVRVDPPRRGLGAASVFEVRHPYGDQIEDLADVEHHAQDGRAHHEVGEHRLLGGPGYVAVHHIGTGLDVALHLPGQPEAVVDVMQQVEEGDLEGGLDEEAQQVSPPQAAVLLARVVVQPRLVAVLGPVLALALLPVGHVQHHHEGRAGDEDELQGPEADVGDGEEVVVADVGASRLPGVAVELALVVAPDPLGGHNVDQHPEDEDHRQPDAAEGGGVLVDSAEETLEELPIHEVYRDSAARKPEGYPEKLKGTQKNWKCTQKTRRILRKLEGYLENRKGSQQLEGRTHKGVSQETAMLYAGAELSLPLSTILVFSGSLNAEFSFPLIAVRTIMKELSLAAGCPAWQHSTTLFPHR
ncbi:hypothetical protein EYF80_048188 [Liparis tanakae]|uniref:Uncharacterized protein n=1 Tax=Liparis tanakae TaxID=230148 RepID=A0A4Z2FKH8_9TELE|nr:hypothetical protein EYF80_048188 [Liparis tanakae]